MIVVQIICLIFSCIAILICIYGMIKMICYKEAAMAVKIFLLMLCNAFFAVLNVLRLTGRI